MSNKDWKCGNCGVIDKDKILSWSTGDVRDFCNTCGPLCDECTKGGGLLSNKKCKGCNNKTETQNFNHRTKKFE